MTLSMTTTLLLHNLLEIEQAVGNTEDLTLRAMLMKAQNQVLALEREHLQVLEEVCRLRAACTCVMASPPCSVCPLCRKDPARCAVAAHA